MSNDISNNNGKTLHERVCQMPQGQSRYTYTENTSVFHEGYVGTVLLTRLTFCDAITPAYQRK